MDDESTFSGMYEIYSLTREYPDTEALVDFLYENIICRSQRLDTNCTLTKNKFNFTSF
jgi:hypothetical protein